MSEFFSIFALYPVGNKRIWCNKAGQITSRGFSRETQLLDIYEGKISNWSQVGGNDDEIELWVYEQEDDLQVAFSEIMLKGKILSSMARQASNEKKQVSLMLLNELQKEKKENNNWSTALYWFDKSLSTRPLLDMHKKIKEAL